MADGTFPGAPRGFNARITIARYGRRFVRVTELVHGLTIVSAESEASQRRAYYPVMAVQSDFSLTLEWKSTAERNGFNAWMRQYMRRVSGNDDSISGYATVQIPDRGFTRNAVPHSTLDWQDSPELAKWMTRLTFVGASDPVDQTLTARQGGLSYLILPSDPVARHFYPTGNQIKGTATDSPFDGAPPMPPEVPGVPTPGHEPPDQPPV